MSAGQSAMCDTVLANSVEAKWDHGRSILSTPLPDFVIAPTFVPRDKFG